MTKLFKYTESQYYNNLVKNGSVKIGTLKGYQNSEVGGMVKDELEGSKVYSGHIQYVDHESILKSSTLTQVFGRGAPGSHIENLTVENLIIEEQNFYIFSMADNYSRIQHLKWNENHNYTSAYQIISTDFFDIITHELNKISPVKYVGICRVHYYDEINGMDFFDSKEAYPAFALKNRSNFEDQSELRAVWHPEEGKEITEKIITNIMLSHCVSKDIDLNSFLYQ